MHRNFWVSNEAYDYIHLSVFKEQIAYFYHDGSSKKFKRVHGNVYEGNVLDILKYVLDNCYDSYPVHKFENTLIDANFLVIDFKEDKPFTKKEQEIVTLNYVYRDMLRQDKGSRAIPHLFAFPEEATSYLGNETQLNLL